MNAAGQRILIADTDRGMVARLSARLASGGHTMAGSATSADAAAREIAARRADILILDQSACDGEMATVVRRIVAEAPHACVLVTGPSGTAPRVMGRAVAAGARGFLLKPYTDDDMQGLVNEVSASRHAAQGPERSRRGRLISVYGPKGGVGRTTVAINLAVALAQTGSSVGLVDLDLQFGDVGVALGLKGANSIVELVGHEVLTGEIVRDTFIEHPSGVRVLLAPDDLSQVESLDPFQVRDVLERLRASFDYVVCDLWSMFEDLTRSTLKASDQVVLVTTPEVPALRNLQRVLVAGRGELKLDERALIVLNRAEGKTGFKTAEVAKALERPIALAIPSDGIGITDAVNRGVSLLDPRVHCRTARHYRELAKLVKVPDERPARVVGMAPLEAA